MAAPDSTIRLGQVGLEQSIENAIKKVNASGRLKLNINSNSFTQPLGRITAATDEFTKSIEASNARVIAFGASVGVINAVSNAFKSLVKETVALEQRLTEVNVILGAGSDQLKSFGKELFNIARNTSQSFESVSQAALEFSRQGLGVEETLKRTNDALILSRLTSLKASDSVKGLTATMNSFAQAGLNTSQIINKLAAVDVKFAVSSEDLINALSRTGSVAQDAGLSFDELVAAVTSAQQTTARGGAVIGNSFKTIFTRIQRSDTLDRLQELGVAVRNVQGETLPAMMILQQLAKSYDGLTDATKSAVAEQVGGVFQINILKAALRDLNTENSIYSRALSVSAGAANEANIKNQQLNKTLDSLSKQAITNVQQLSAAIGEITVGPGIEKVLNAINDLSQGASKLLDGEGIGSTLANGVLKGLGTVISGPGLILIGGLMLKLFVDTARFATSSFNNLLGLNKKSKEQKTLQDSILATLQSNRQISAVLAQLEGNKAAQSKFLLDQVKLTTNEYTKQVNLAKQLAASLGQAGVVGGPGGLSTRTGRRAAGGFIPNFSAEGREMMDIKKGVGGVSPSAKPVRLKNFNMGGGQVGDMVANSQEYYVKNFNGRGGDAVFNPDMVQKYGMPYGAKKINAANGYVPNFAGKMGIGAARKYDEASAIARLNDPGQFTTASGRSKFLTAAITSGFKVPEKLQEKIRNEASLESTKKKSGAIRIIIDGSKYGVVTTEKGGSTSKNFVGITQSDVFGKNIIPDKKIDFDIHNLFRGRVSEQRNPSLQKLINDNIFTAIKNIANELLKTHGMGGTTKAQLNNVLDKTAGPQLKGRIFESVLDYAKYKVTNDAGGLNDKQGNETFDYPSGIPSELNKIFGPNAKTLNDKPTDSKYNMSTKGAGPGSMVRKIFTASHGNKGKLSDFLRRVVGSLPDNRKIFTINDLELAAAGHTFKDVAERKYTRKEQLQRKFYGYASNGYIPNFARGLRRAEAQIRQDPRKWVDNQLGSGGTAGLRWSNATPLSRYSRGETSEVKKLGSVAAKLYHSGGKNSFKAYQDVYNSLSPYARRFFAKPLGQVDNIGLFQSLRKSHVMLPEQYTSGIAKKLQATLEREGIKSGPLNNKAWGDLAHGNIMVKKGILESKEVKQIIEKAKDYREATDSVVDYLMKKGAVKIVDASLAVNRGANGYIPNLSGGVNVSDIPALSDSIMREKAAGIPSSAIRINTDKRLVNSGNPNGLAVTNIIDEPRGMRDVFAANGYIPNFAIAELTSKQIDKTRFGKLGPAIEEQKKLIEKYNSELQQLIQSIQEFEGKMDEAAKKTSEFQAEKDQVEKRKGEITKQKKSNTAEIKKLKKEKDQLIDPREKAANTRNIKKLTKENEQLTKEQNQLYRRRIKIEQDILASTQREQEASQQIAQAKQKQATAEKNKSIAETNSTNLTSARDQRASSRQAAMQGAGMQAAFIVPMLTASVEQAYFKGMERAEMTRGERQAQAALQGVGEGAGFAVIVQTLMTSLGVVNPLFMAIGVGLAALVPILLRLKGAAELTAEEQIKSVDKLKSTIESDLDAARKIVELRKRALAAGGDKDKISEINNDIRRTFSEIQGDKLKNALSNTTDSVVKMDEVIQEFSKKASKTNFVLDNLNKSISSMDKSKRGSFWTGTSGQLYTDRTDALDILIALGNMKSEIAPEKMESLQQSFQKELELASKFTVMPGTQERNNFQFPVHERDAAYGIASKEFVDKILDSFVEAQDLNQASEEKAKLVLKGLIPKMITQTEKGFKDDETPSIDSVLRTFEVIRTLLNSSNANTDAPTVDTQELFDYNQLSMDIAAFAKSRKNIIEDKVEKTKFGFKIDDLLKDLIFSQSGGLDVTGAEKSFKMQRVIEESGIKKRDFITSQIDEIQKTIGKPFVEGAALGKDKALEYQTAIGHFLDGNIDNAINDLESLARGYTGADKQDIQDLLEKLKKGSQKLKNDTAEQQEIVQLEDQIKNIKIKNSEAILKIQTELSAKINDSNIKIQQINSDLSYKNKLIDLALSDPLRRSGGNFGIESRRLAEIQKLDNQKAAIEERKKQEINIALQEALKNEGLIRALGGAEGAIDQLKEVIEERGKQMTQGASTQPSQVIPTLDPFQGPTQDPIEQVFGGPNNAVLPTSTSPAASDNATIQSINSIDPSGPYMQELFNVVKAKAISASLENQDISKSVTDFRNFLTNPSDSQITEFKSLNQSSLSQQDLKKLNPDDLNNIVNFFIQILNIIKQNQNEIQGIENEKNLTNIGFNQEKSKNTFGAGVASFSTQIHDEMASFSSQLGYNIPMAFRDGMVEALQVAINQSENLGDTLRNIAINFLQTIQKAFLQHSVNQVMGMIGFNEGGPVQAYAKGGLVQRYAKGGSVAKGVPSMLTNGEYVIGRDAAQRIGTEKLAMINSGEYKPQGYASGGKVGNKSRQAYAKHMSLFNSQFSDDKSSLFYAQLWKDNPLATKEVELKIAADDEAHREAEQKKEERRALRNSIIGIGLSVVGAYATQAIGGMQQASRLKAAQSGGNFVIRGGGGKGIQGQMVNNSFTPTNVSALNAGQKMTVSNFNNLLAQNNNGGINALTIDDMKSLGLSFGTSWNSTKYHGGKIQGYASGGKVYGPAGRDVIPAVLTEGEYVIKASSARKYGKRFLDGINNGSRRFYEGGSTSVGGGGGSTQNVNFNMNFDVSNNQNSSTNSEDDKSQRDSGKQLEEFAKRMRAIATEEIARQQRVGGLLNRPRR